MTLDRLTQITSSGISSDSTITVSAIAGVITATSATVSGNLSGNTASFSGNLSGNTASFSGNITGIAASFSSNVNIVGVTTVGGGIIVAAGSTSAPSITPSGDPNTGIFFPSPDTVAIGEGGTEVLRVDSSGRVGVGTNRLSRPFEVWSGTAGTSFSVDSSGRVQMPYQPCFHAAGDQATTFTNQVVPFNVSLTNNGGHYSTSTYRFTAPIAGHYFFTFHAILGPDSSGSAIAHIRRNANVVATIHRNTSSSYMFPWEQGACSAVLYLNVSDYVDCFITSSGTIYSGANIVGAPVYSAFNGHLIG